MRSPLTGTLVVTIAALAALAIVPRDVVPGAAASAPTIELAHFPAPSQDLLRRLDAEVAPPKVVTPRPAPGPTRPVAPAAVQSASLVEPAASAVPAPFEPDTRIGPSAVNMRNGPSTSASTIVVLTAGTPVATIGTSRGWANVRLTDGREGWVYSAYLAGGPYPAAADELRPNPARSPRTATITSHDDGPLTNRSARIGSTVATYQRPSDNSPSLFLLQPGERVRIVEDRGDWIRVVSPSGISGWIRRAG